MDKNSRVIGNTRVTALERRCNFGNCKAYEWLIDLVVQGRLKAVCRGTCSRSEPVLSSNPENIGNTRHWVKLKICRAVETLHHQLHFLHSLMSLPSICSLLGRRQNVYPLKILNHDAYSLKNARHSWEEGWELHGQKRDWLKLKFDVILQSSLPTHPKKSSGCLFSRKHKSA